ncbi:uncharacterized protein [Eurosta solidaginis]|uniref:uncharacterized protein n=1 Tax=Eurosta solidaginis TaxID=178769 RepID=UPI00353123E6
MSDPNFKVVEDVEHLENLKETSPATLGGEMKGEVAKKKSVTEDQLSNDAADTEIPQTQREDGVSNIPAKRKLSVDDSKNSPPQKRTSILKTQWGGEAFKKELKPGTEVLRTSVSDDHSKEEEAIASTTTTPIASTICSISTSESDVAHGTSSQSTSSNSFSPIDSESIALLKAETRCATPEDSYPISPEERNTPTTVSNCTQTTFPDATSAVAPEPDARNEGNLDPVTRATSTGIIGPQLPLMSNAPKSETATMTTVQLTTDSLEAVLPESIPTQESYVPTTTAVLASNTSKPNLLASSPVSLKQSQTSFTVAQGTIFEPPDHVMSDSKVNAVTTNPKKDFTASNGKDTDHVTRVTLDGRPGAQPFLAADFKESETLTLTNTEPTTDPIDDVSSQPKAPDGTTSTTTAMHVSNTETLDPLATDLKPAADSSTVSDPLKLPCRKRKVFFISLPKFNKASLFANINAVMSNEDPLGAKTSKRTVVKYVNTSTKKLLNASTTNSTIINKSRAVKYFNTSTKKLPNAYTTNSTVINKTRANQSSMHSPASTSTSSEKSNASIESVTNMTEQPNQNQSLKRKIDANKDVITSAQSSLQSSTTTSTSSQTSKICIGSITNMAEQPNHNQSLIRMIDANKAVISSVQYLLLNSSGFKPEEVKPKTTSPASGCMEHKYEDKPANSDIVPTLSPSYLKALSMYIKTAKEYTNLSSKNHLEPLVAEKVVQSLIKKVRTMQGEVEAREKCTQTDEVGIVLLKNMAALRAKVKQKFDEVKSLKQALRFLTPTEVVAQKIKQITDP